MHLKSIFKQRDPAPGTALHRVEQLDIKTTFMSDERHEMSFRHL